MKYTKPLHRNDGKGTAAEPDTGLPGLIRFANFVPADAELPDFPDEKCVRLGSGDFDDVAAEREFSRFLDENFPRERFAEFRDFFDAQRLHALLKTEALPPPSWVLYTYVREAHEALRMIATHKRERLRLPGSWFFPWEQIGGWKLDRIRVCEKCGKLFFANRANKLTCSERCSTARRVERFRERQSQYEQARKLKLARTTQDTKVKTQKAKAQGGKNVPNQTR